MHDEKGDIEFLPFCAEKFSQSKLSGSADAIGKQEVAVELSAIGKMARYPAEQI